MNKAILILAFVSSIILFSCHPIKQKIISKHKDFFGQLNQKQLNFNGLENLKDSVNLIKNTTCIFMIFFTFFTIYFMFVIV